jgi:hypothetical protein
LDRNVLKRLATEGRIVNRNLLVVILNLGHAESLPKGRAATGTGTPVHIRCSGGAGGMEKVR